MIDFLSKLPFWFLVGASGIASTAGDYLAKYWSVHQKPAFFYSAILVYGLAGLFYAPVLLKHGLVITAVLWGLVSTVGFLIIGLVIFHETLTTLQTVGVLLGIISLLILAIDI